MRIQRWYYKSPSPKGFMSEDSKDKDLDQKVTKEFSIGFALSMNSF
jgi:hypothetical protein